MNLKAAYRPYRREFLKPLVTAHGEWTEREGFLVRLESESGVGYGEIAPIPEFGTETMARAANFLQQWADDPIIMPSGLPCCHFALSSALQQLKQPIGPAVRDYTVAGLLPAGVEALARVREKVAAGYTVLKWKIGVAAFEEERELLLDLLKLMPERVSLRLDANGGLGPGSFRDWLALVSAHRERIEYLEQPMPPGDEGLMQELSEKFRIPVALDESLNMPDRERWLLPDAWRGPLVIKPLLMGNISVLCEQLKPLAGQLVFSSVFETGIGLSLALNLADALPSTKHAIGFDTLSAFGDDLCGLSASPQIATEDRTALDPEAIWNRLPHSN